MHEKKAGPVHDTVFPYHTTDTGAYQQWKSLVQSRFTTCNDDIKETENIYCSAHWVQLSLLQTLILISVFMVISAGLGLRHSSDPAIPYDATFTKDRKKERQHMGYADF